MYTHTSCIQYKIMSIFLKKNNIPIYANKIKYFINSYKVLQLITLFKNKSDAQVCGNYRSIKLLSHTMKLRERVIEIRIRQETMLRENQFGFMSGRTSTEAIHILKRLMKSIGSKRRIYIWCSLI